MRLRHISAVAGLLLTLQGCATPHIPDRYVVPDEGWEGEFKLAPGDVIHLVTFIKGNPVPADGGGQNIYPPFSEHIRLPVREARTVLTADEANLLMGFLATGSEPRPADGTVTELEFHRVELWNALAASLVLRKLEATTPAQLNVSMDDFCPRFRAIPEPNSALRATFFVMTCKPNSEKRRQTMAARQAAFAAELNAARKEQPDVAVMASQEMLPTRELRHIAILSRPLDAVVSTSSTLEKEDYYSIGQASVAVSVAAVERGTATMRNVAGAERRWSLADWERSGICPGHIVNVSLRTEPLRLLRIMPTGMDARYEITSTGPGTRSVAAHVPEGPFETLTADSLAFLSPSDIKQIRWGEARREFPPNPIVTLSENEHWACTP